MPYKFEKKHIPKNFDRRIKLSIKQKEEIKAMYKPLIFGYQKIANVFNVSKTTIRRIVDPEKLEKDKLYYKERGKDRRYYDKEKRREYMQNYRLYKKELNDKNLLIN